MFEKARTENLRSSVAMEMVMGDDDPSGSFSIRDDEKKEAVDLLEERWFFDNFFEGRKMMSRCFSDPCTSSNFCQEMMVRNKYIPTGKLHSSVSLPCTGRRGAVQEEKPGSELRKSIKKPAQNHSLPPGVGSKEGEEVQVKDLEVVKPDLLRGSKLTRTTSNPSHLLPPPQHTSKVCIFVTNTSKLYMIPIKLKSYKF